MLTPPGGRRQGLGWLLGAGGRSARRWPAARAVRDAAAADVAVAEALEPHLVLNELVLGLATSATLTIGVAGELGVEHGPRTKLTCVSLASLTSCRATATLSSSCVNDTPMASMRCSMSSPTPPAPSTLLKPGARVASPNGAAGDATGYTNVMATPALRTCGAWHAARRRFTPDPYPGDLRAGAGTRGAQRAGRHPYPGQARDPRRLSQRSRRGPGPGGRRAATGRRRSRGSGDE